MISDYKANLNRIGMYNLEIVIYNYTYDKSREAKNCTTLFLQ